jgi:hypothetical protein
VPVVLLQLLLLLLQALSIPIHNSIIITSTSTSFDTNTSSSNTTTQPSLRPSPAGVPRATRHPRLCPVRICIEPLLRQRGRTCERLFHAEQLRARQ